MFKKRTRSLFFTTFSDKLAWIYYKLVTSLADDAPIEFPNIIFDHREDYLDLTYTMLSLHIRVETPPILGVASTTPASAVKVDPVNHLLYSMFD